MSKTIASKFLRHEGTDVFNGNELLFKGALETEGGVHLLTGYPGSPVSAFFDVIARCASLLKEHGIEGRISNNEALAVAAVNGSQMAPLRAMAVCKSVGLHVASDALALGNLAGPHPAGGAVIVVGDDPWSESTQVPADSRFLFRHLFVPVIEPSTPQEVKDYIGAAFELSRESGLYLGYIITTTLADGGGTVTCGPNHYPLTSTLQPIDLDTLSLDLENRVLLPPRTGRREVGMPERYERLADAVRRMGLNGFTDAPGQDEILVVTSGLAYQYVQQAIEDLGLAGHVAVLKLAITFPLDRHEIEPLLARFEHVVVVEERRSFIEEQIAQIALQLSQNESGRVAKLWGKQFPGGSPGFRAAMGLNVSIVTERLGRLLWAIESPLARRAAARIEAEQRFMSAATRDPVHIPPRTPSFCPGCPHRDSADVLLEIKERFTDHAYMRKHHGSGPVDLVFHGDTGCYTMLMFEPNTPLMHNYSGMGLGGGTGSGIDPFIRNKQVVFMGDSTFFHSGATAISNSIANRQDITYIILANGTTAMTGHQPLPTVQTDLLQRPVAPQEILGVVRGITGGRCPVICTDPGDRPEYKKLLEETILADGVKVIIADKECGITSQRRRMKLERLEQEQGGFVRRKVYMNVTPEVCEFCLECTSKTGCPGLTIESTDYGSKMSTDLSWCVNDGACAKLGSCPSFEEVIVTRKQPPTPRGHRIMLADIPDPVIQFQGDVWRAWIAGVGGMGIGTATAVLVHAAQHDGLAVQFSDKKGLAIRNGGVYSQLTLSRNGRQASMTLGYGKADLLLGMDLLEAVRAIDPASPFLVASPERTAIVVNSDVAPTIRTLLGRDQSRPEEWEAALRRMARPGQFSSARVAALCERIFGTKLYVNLTMLGIAYQRGLIPLSLEAIQTGIRKTMKVDVEKNLRAFDVGRKLVSHPELFGEIFGEVQESRSLARTVRAKAAYLNMRQMGARRALRSDQPGGGVKRRLADTPLARTYKHLTYTTLRACRELDRRTMRDIAVRIHDLIQWGGIRYARRYVQRIRRVFLADQQHHDFQATRAVVHNLARLMLIKDEFYVSYLLTSYEKLRRDRQRYNVNPANGDRIKYRRVFHPRFFGRQVDIRLPHWCLYVIRNLRFLRRPMFWHRLRERRFLRWYERLVDGFCSADEAAYDRYVELLQLPDSVRGYAEFRWPKMKEVRDRADQILSRGSSTAVEAGSR
jgi:indolepyruvate ferredoxin oxidoreductase